MCDIWVASVLEKGMPKKNSDSDLHAALYSDACVKNLAGAEFVVLALPHF